MGLGKHFSFCEEPITHSTSTNMEEITNTWRNMSLSEREDSDFAPPKGTTILGVHPGSKIHDPSFLEYGYCGKNLQTDLEVN